jgi:hypothetical protein
MMWRTSGNTLLFDDGRSVEFVAPVREAIEVDGTIVVRLEYYQSPIDNVFGVRDAKVVWQIAARPEASGSYTSLSQTDGKVFIFDWHCFLYRIDPSTGAVLTPCSRSRATEWRSPAHRPLRKGEHEFRRDPMAAKKAKKTSGDRLQARRRFRSIPERIPTSCGNQGGASSGALCRIVDSRGLRMNHSVVRRALSVRGAVLSFVVIGDKVVQGARWEQGPKPAEVTERSFAALAAPLKRGLI